MAAAATPAPGTKYGPCINDCAHRDCACSRREASALCRICGAPIGYDAPWYASIDGINGAVHELCAES